MVTRRTMLDLGKTAVLFTAFTGFAAAASRAQEGPLFRFGVVADPQYAPVPPRRTRYYANSLWKLSEAVAFFNTQDLRFVVTLGDIIDRHWESYDHILPIYDRLEHPHFFVLGNHDFEVATDYLGSVTRVTGLKRAYYDFAGGGYRFLVIDGNDVSLFAHPEGSPEHGLAAERLAALEASGAPNAQTWNGGMGDEQLAWLERTMDAAQAAGERVIIFGHYPILPRDEHNMWGDDRVVELVSRYSSFVAFMNGHNHAGNYAEANGKHFLNLMGMVETPAETAYAIIEVYGDRVEVRGYGREASRTLRI